MSSVANLYIQMGGNYAIPNHWLLLGKLESFGLMIQNGELTLSTQVLVIDPTTWRLALGVGVFYPLEERVFGRGYLTEKCSLKAVISVEDEIQTVIFEDLRITSGIKWPLIVGDLVHLEGIKEWKV